MVDDQLLIADHDSGGVKNCSGSVNSRLLVWAIHRRLRS
jgi:hypothetical protein